MEIGFGQSPAIEEEVGKLDGLSLEAVHEDLHGIPRVITARKI